MRQPRFYIAILLSISVFMSLLPFAQIATAQDLVTTEDVGGGSSVFVFRESRKKPQAKTGAGRVSVGQGAGRAGNARSASQIAAAAKKRRADAAAARKKAAIAAANKKIAASNMLTATMTVSRS